MEIWSETESQEAEDARPMKGQGQGKYKVCADQILCAPGPSFLLIIKSAPIYICGKQTFSPERMEVKSANCSAFRTLGLISFFFTVTVRVLLLERIRTEHSVQKNISLSKLHCCYTPLRKVDNSFEPF